MQDEVFKWKIFDGPYCSILVRCFLVKLGGHLRLDQAGEVEDWVGTEITNDADF